MKNSMTYKGYTASMVFGAVDKIIVGRVQELDDILVLHGESVSALESSFHAVVDAYLAASETLNSAPGNPASGKLMLRIEGCGQEWDQPQQMGRESAGPSRRDRHQRCCASAHHRLMPCRSRLHVAFWLPPARPLAL